MKTHAQSETEQLQRRNREAVAAAAQRGLVKLS
jgi:hypothetical protein